MATTQIKDGFNGGSDNQLLINADGSININGGGGGEVSTNLNEVGGVPFNLGQQVSGLSLPVVLTAAQISTLTPLSTVTANIGTTGGIALDSTLLGLSAKFGSLGQKTMAGSAPVVFASDQSALPVTGTFLITNYALETGGHLASIDSKVPSLGQAVASASVPVVLTAAQLSTLTPLSSVTVTQTTAANLNATAVTTGGATIAKDSSLTTINTTLGSPFQAGGSIGNTAFIANAGTNLNTSLLQLDATGAKLNLAQASTTSGQTGPLIQGAVTTAAPTYTTAQTSPLSLTTAGALRTDMSTVSGAAVSTGNGVAGTGVQRMVIASDQTAFSINAVQSGTWNVTSSGGALALDASVTGLQVALASTTSGQKGGLSLAAVTTAAPSYTTAQTNALSLTTAGGLRSDVSSISGATALAGNGVTGTGSLRVTVASDNTAFTVNTTNQLAATDVASAAITVTTTTAAFTPSVTANSQQFVVVVTAVAGTLPTLSIVVQESPDGGVNWRDRIHFQRISAVGIFATPFITIGGNRVRYVQTVTGSAGQSFTRAITRNTSLLPGKLLYVFRDRTIDPATTNSVTPTFYMEGATHVSIFANTGGTNVTNSNFTFQRAYDTSGAWATSALTLSIPANGNADNSAVFGSCLFGRITIPTGVAGAFENEVVITATG